MTLGWTRFVPKFNLIESHSINAGNNACAPSDIYLEFGDNLDYIIKLRCESKDHKTYEVYRFKAETISRDKMKAVSENSIQVGEQVQSVSILETYDYQEIGDTYTDQYFPNAIIFEFVSGNFLAIYGQEGDDQCEPCHYINFIPYDEIEIYKIERMKGWKEWMKMEIRG